MHATTARLRYWWVFALRGALGVLFGVVALAMPGLTLLSLIAVFAVYALLAGIVAVAGALSNRHNASDWWILLTLGLAGILAGALASLHPALTALVLVIVIGLNAILTGLLDIMLAVRLRNVVRGEWLLLLSAATSLAFGALIIAYPGAGALALVWLIGTYALLTGLLYLVMAYRAYMAEARPPTPSGDGGRVERRSGERRMRPAGH
ncbi:HdeD family acid-resistance protein [Janthinobacterium sp.]|uniref:HdeD family acid-resistance protein n=1 Tax=Janthinobacterium sp. TaxID=1871054 RepID=UPI00293D2933|nr:HdeD family acid-resistance protein [Janthinobacterium sp.]